MNQTGDIKTLPIPKDPPDLDRFAAALLALAIERVEAAKAAVADPTDDDKADDA